MTGSEIINEAKKYLGQNGKKFCADYGLPWGEHWCCAFVWDIFRMSDASKLFYGGQKTAYVPTATVWMQANLRHVTMTEARAGDIVVFTWDGKGYNKERGSRDHIGFIRKAGNQNACYTIEGNTGAGSPTKTTVMERTRASKYIYGIYRPKYSDSYIVKFVGRGGTGTLKQIRITVGEKRKLPKNVFTRPGFKFVGWSVGKSDYVNMKRFQIGKPKFKNKDEVKDLAKAGKTVKLYACWQGTGPEAAALWARRLAKDNSFMYGADDHKNWYHGRDRAHQVGCYFCGTNITGAKKAKKGDRWNKTYCCNSFVMASYVHGAGLFKKCKGGSTQAAYWTKLKKDGKPLFRIVGTNLKYSQLKAGDILCSKTHVKEFTGISKMGFYLVSHAAGEGWDNKSIRTERVTGRVGKKYTVVRYIG